jgi:hypothetical protein
MASLTMVHRYATLVAEQRGRHYSENPIVAQSVRAPRSGLNLTNSGALSYLRTSF